MSKRVMMHRPQLMGTEWMITTDHPLATMAGAAVLEKGGNAVDAAIAANLVLTVVRPHMCGPGGDFFALFFWAATGEFTALNGSGRAPAAATPEEYRRRGHQVMPQQGLLAATVPGAISAWEAALERYGTMKLDQLLPRAISYAENGFPNYHELHAAMEAERSKLQQSPAAMEIFFPGGGPVPVGSLVRQPQLARFYRVLAEQGPEAFYRGRLGQALVDFSAAHGGLFHLEDLASHTSTWTEPIGTGYRDYRLFTHPPNSQGIALLMLANILENADLGKMDLVAADAVHLMVEAKKLAFADRDRYVADPEFVPVPVAQLLDKDQARSQYRRIDPRQAATAVAPRRFTQGGRDTIYLAVVDGEGNAVSLIQSIFQPFGSGVMVPELGIILHNRAAGFSLGPNHPNCLAPGKRPYHTLHPAMVFKDGRPYMVLGTPGADGQPQTNMQVLARVLDQEMDIQAAMEAPRWRSNPDGTLLLESRFPAHTVKELQSRGHQVKVVGEFDLVMGSSQGIIIDDSKGALLAGACPRRNAYAIGR